jgi:hypothetical protein
MPILLAFLFLLLGFAAQAQTPQKPAPPKAPPPRYAPQPAQPPVIGTGTGDMRPGVPSAGTYTPSSVARALGQRTFQDSGGDVVTTHPNLLGGQTYVDLNGNTVITRPTIQGGEVMRDSQGRIMTSRPNLNGGYTFTDADGKITICRPTINGQYFCQDQADAPGLANPRAIRDGLAKTPK